MLSLIITLALGIILLLPIAWRFQTMAATFVAYGLHAVSAVAIYALAGGVAVPDAEHYHDQAVQLITGESDNEVTPGKELWTYLLRTIYVTFGVEPGIAIALNVVLVSLLPTISAQIAGSLSLNQKLSAWAAALVPQSLLWGVLLLRESLVWVALLVGVLAIAKLYADKDWRIWVPVFVASLVLFAYSRGTIAVVFALGSLAVLAFVKKSWKLAAGTAISVAVCAVVFPGLSGILTKFSRDSAYLSKVPEPIVQPSAPAASPRPTGSAGVLDPTATTSPAPNISVIPDVDPDTISSTPFQDFGFGHGIVELLSTKLSALVNVTFGPLPTDIGRMNIAYIADGFIWILVLGLAVFAFFRITDRRAAFVLIIPAVLILLAMGWTLTEFGTTVRLRLMPLYILLPLAATGFGFMWQWIRTRTRQRDTIRSVG